MIGAKSNDLICLAKLAGFIGYYSPVVPNAEKKKSKAKTGNKR